MSILFYSGLTLPSQINPTRLKWDGKMIVKYINCFWILQVKTVILWLYIITVLLPQK